MLLPFINVNGESHIAVFIPRETVDQSEAIFTKVREELTQIVYPKITAYLEKQAVLKSIDDAKTIEELEAMRYDLIYEGMYTELATLLDQREDLQTDTERAFCAAELSRYFIDGLVGWIREQQLQRAQAIARKPKSKIIMP